MPPQHLADGLTNYYPATTVPIQLINYGWFLDFKKLKVFCDAK